MPECSAGKFIKKGCGDFSMKQAFIKMYCTLFLVLPLLVGCESASTVIEKIEESRDTAGNYIGEIKNLVSDSDLKDKVSVVADVDVETENNNPLRDQENAETSKDFSSFEKAKVVGHVDGDTIDVLLDKDKSKQRIRMILINTPETKGEYEKKPQPFGEEASEFTYEMLKSKTVWLEYDVEKTDRYGRTLAYIWLKELNYTRDGQTYKEKEVLFNEVLLRHGLAHVAVYKPNERYKERFYKVEETAKANRLGIWE